MKEDTPILQVPVADNPFDASSTDGATADPVSRTSKKRWFKNTGDREKDLFNLWTQRFYHPNREQRDSEIEWDVRLTIWDQYDKNNGIAWDLGIAKHQPFGEARKIAKRKGLLSYEPLNEPINREARDPPSADLPMPDYAEGAPDPGREMLLKNMVLRYNEWETERDDYEENLRKNMQQELEDIGSRRRFLKLQTKVLESATKATLRRLEDDYHVKSKENKRIAAELKAEMKTIAARFDLNLDLPETKIVLPSTPSPRLQMDTDSRGGSPLQGTGSKSIKLSSSNLITLNATFSRQSKQAKAKELKVGESSALKISAEGIPEKARTYTRRYNSDEESNRRNTDSTSGKHKAMKQDFGQRPRQTHQSRRINRHQANLQFDREPRTYMPGRRYQDMNFRGRSRSPRDSRKGGRDMDMDQRRFSRPGQAYRKLSSYNVAQESNLRNWNKRGELDKEGGDEDRGRGYAGFPNSSK